MGNLRTYGLKFLASVALVILVALLMPGAVLAFNDVPSGHQYFEAISDLTQRGIMSGYDGTNFGPTKPITRQQFAKVIVLTLNIPVSGSSVSPFKDVAHLAGDLYPYHYVAAAASRGITTGVTATSFKPYNNVTRAQVITMVVRAVQTLKPDSLDAPAANFVSAWGNFNATHAANATLAEANGLLEGLAPTGTSLSSLDPMGSMPRGEVAQVLHNLLTLLDEGSGTIDEPPLPPADPPTNPPTPPSDPPTPPTNPPTPPSTPPTPPTTTPVDPPVTPPDPPVNPPTPPPTPPDPPVVPPDPPINPPDPPPVPPDPPVNPPTPPPLPPDPPPVPPDPPPVPPTPPVLEG